MCDRVHRLCLHCTGGCQPPSFSRCIVQNFNRFSCAMFSFFRILPQKCSHLHSPLQLPLATHSGGTAANKELAEFQTMARTQNFASLCCCCSVWFGLVWTHPLLVWKIPGTGARRTDTLRVWMQPRRTSNRSTGGGWKCTWHWQ